MRIIIHSDMPDACKFVQRVIDQGMLSDNGTCYCYITVFSNNVQVSCDKTKTGFVFYVHNIK